MKISELAEQFYELHVLAENKPSQQKSVREITRNWIVPYLGDKDVTALTSLDVAFWRTKMKKAGLAPASINLRMKTLSKMLSCGRAWGLPSKVEFAYLPIPETEKEFFSEAQIERIFKVSGQPPWGDMITMALHTGLRIGELRALTWKGVDIEERKLRVFKAGWSHSPDVVSPKSRKARTVSLNDEACRVLAALPRREYVFTIDGRMLAYSRCRDALLKILDAAGIQGNYGWHSFRHTFGSHIAMAGESLRTLQTLMGHANIVTTMGYAHLSPDAGQKTVSVLNKFKRK